MCCGLSRTRAEGSRLRIEKVSLKQCRIIVRTGTRGENTAESAAAHRSSDPTAEGTAGTFPRATGGSMIRIVLRTFEDSSRWIPFAHKKRLSLRKPLLTFMNDYSITSVTTPEPTVLPPSLIANLSPSSIAIGVISSISMTTLSPGMHISVPSGRCRSPVTSVVLK